ncbi:hypothetical protein LJK87_32310 [Paenibacillus sp. P25]|nr:hypothetical protein LJK87_32310 [Paenibacillus sp. P25]
MSRISKKTKLISVASAAVLGASILTFQAVPLLRAADNNAPAGNNGAQRPAAGRNAQRPATGSAAGAAAGRRSAGEREERAAGRRQVQRGGRERQFPVAGRQHDGAFQGGG